MLMGLPNGLIKKFYSGNIVNEEKVKQKSKRFLFCFDLFFHMMIYSSIGVGIFVNFTSFGLIFYFEKPYFFFILFITLLSMYTISSALFLLLSITGKIFNKIKYPFLQFGITLITTLLLFLNAFLFLSFRLTENGYTVDINIWIYIIDFIIIIPIYTYFAYHSEKLFLEKMKKYQ